MLLFDGSDFLAKKKYFSSRMIVIMKQLKWLRNQKLVKGGLELNLEIVRVHKRRTGWVPSRQEQWELVAKLSAAG